MTEIIEGKSIDRVKYHVFGSDDFWAEYNMLLMDGVTCSECKHSERCNTMFGGKDTNTSCQFYPNRFQHKS
jgi:hypothetical protein